MNVSELSGTALPDGVADHLREQGIEELYPPQAEAVEAGILDGENLVASVPTASGKTLIATLAMLSTVERGGTALYIVPLRALASEKAEEFEQLERFGCSVGVSTGNYESDGDWLRQCDVVVATSEKVDSLLRNDAAWIEDVRCVVSDEVHLVDDPNRGPTLEVTLAKLRRTTPSLQVVALSATVGNADALADWLDAALVDTDWRPVELNTGVHRDDRISFADGSTKDVPVERGERQEAALVRDALGDEGSSLVFVNSRKNAEAAAKRLSGVVDPHLDAENRAALEGRAAAIRDASDTATSESLAAAVERGAAFHHAGLSRDSRAAVEDAFREREIKVVCATPTLAAGVNTPSRRVIVRDWRRYDSTAGGMAPLDTLEVHQMFGRAGRPGRDPVGEAVLLASNDEEETELFDRYVYADPEPVRSKLAAEPALRTHVLATVATGFAADREELLAFLDGTLYAHQTTEPGRLADVVDAVCEYLVANEFLERDRAGPDGSDALRATPTGHLVSQLYVDPMSAATIIDGLRAAGEDAGAEDGGPSALGLYQLVSRTPDMYQLYLRSGDRETYTEIFYEREDELLGRAPSEFADAEFEEYLSALKTARLLEDWADEVDEDRIAERYGVGPGDVRGKVETASWLLGAAERLAGDIDAGTAPAVRAARKRVEDGVREELLDLTSVRNVGRVRARSLFEAGIEDRTDLRESDPAVALRALDGRRKTTETILENAGHPDPDLEGVSVDDAPAGGSSGASGATAGADGPTATGGDGAGAEGRETTDQTGLGDF